MGVPMFDQPVPQSLRADNVGDSDFLDLLRGRDDLLAQLVLELLAEPSGWSSHVLDLTFQ